MTAPLSNDLRKRVVRAIESGLSRRAAAAKFDVSIASAVRWYQRFKRQGDMRPEPIGGDRTSHRIEAHAARILGWVVRPPALPFGGDGMAGVETVGLGNRHRFLEMLPEISGHFEGRNLWSTAT